jgi:predicted methyltransferase
MRIALLTASLLALAACQQQEAPKAADPAPAPAPVAVEPAPAPVDAFAARFDEVLAGSHRGENTARDEFRRPKETLGFFGLAAGQTVIEITPGGGWYAEVLAPLMKGQGSYVAAIIDPASASSDRAKEYYTKSNQGFRDKLAASPELYGEAQVVEFQMAAPVFGAPASADLVVTFRNVHNWVGQNAAEAMFKGFFDVLKPGGVLGVVEHRAKADDSRPLEEIARSGYFPEALVIEMATKAGFQLAEQSEINANPADTKDYPNGVWTLRPSLNMKDVPETEHERIKAIGESDRMTLKFVKPAG